MPRPKPGAAALLAHPTLRTEDGKPAPVLAATDAGKGRSLALLTDSGWHWGFLAAGDGDDGRTFQRFWENAIRWLVRDPALTLLRLELDRLEYRRDQPIAARVRTMHADYSPASDVPVALALYPADNADRGQTAAHAVGSPPTRTARPTWTCPGWRRAPTAWSGQATIDGRSVTEEQTFVIRPEGNELEDVISQRAVLQRDCRRDRRRATRTAWATRDPQAARGAGGQPAHGRAVVEPAAAAAGDRPPGHGMGPSPPRRARLARSTGATAA